MPQVASHGKSNLKLLFNAGQIQKRLHQLGMEISQDYKGKNLKLIGVLKGSTLFFSDLLKKINIPVQIDFLEISSYHGGTTSSGKVELIKDLSENIENQHVIILDDIVDTGLSLEFIKEHLKQKNPASVKVACLLYKKAKHLKPHEINYCGFLIEDLFVVGYGMDYKGYMRNLEDIYYCIDHQKPIEHWSLSNET